MSDLFTYKVTYSLPEPDDTNALLPKEEREIGRKIMKAMDRQMEQVLFGGYGGYKIHIPHPGRIFEHAPTRPLLEKKP